MRTSKQLGQALWGASECRSGRSSHLLSTPAVQSAGRVAIPSQPLWPLACASALPGEAVSVHGAPPRSLLTPRGQLTTHAISSAPQKALCMPPRHITRLFPVGGGDFWVSIFSRPEAPGRPLPLSVCLHEPAGSVAPCGCPVCVGGQDAKVTYRQRKPLKRVTCPQGPKVLGYLVKWLKWQPQIRHYFHFKRICSLRLSEGELVCLKYSGLQKVNESPAS